MRSANSRLGPPKSCQTVTYEEVPEWQSDNRFILNGYRRAKDDCSQVFTSLTYLHNETCNIYTHLIPAITLPLALLFTIRSVATPKSTDYFAFGRFFCCTEICLTFSTLYHLMQSHSPRAEIFWHSMDLLGITAMIIGTFSSGIYYTFLCEARLQRAYWNTVNFHSDLCFYDLVER